MKYNEIPPVKIGKPYNVPKAFYNENYESFTANYSGEINGNKAAAWRAFEIKYMNEGAKGFGKSKAKVEKIEPKKDKKKSFFDKEEKEENEDY